VAFVAEKLKEANSRYYAPGELFFAAK